VLLNCGGKERAWSRHSMMPRSAIRRCQDHNGLSTANKWQRCMRSEQNQLSRGDFNTVCSVKTESKICKGCGGTFHRQLNDPHWRQRLYCDNPCRVRAASRRYSNTMHGKAQQAEYRASDVRREALARYNASEKFRATQARYRSSEKYKATKARRLASPGGRLAVWMAIAKHRGSIGERLEYERNRHQMLFVEELPCCQCGEIDISKLRVDHIIPRGLGGPHDRSNLQVLCKHHHAIKTRIDMQRIWIVRRKCVIPNHR